MSKPNSGHNCRHAPRTPKKLFSVSIPTRFESVPANFTDVALSAGLSRDWRSLSCSAAVNLDVYLPTDGVRTVCAEMTHRTVRAETELPGSKENRLKPRMRTRQDDTLPSAMTLPVPGQRQMTSCCGMIDSARQVAIVAVIIVIIIIIVT